MKVLIVLSHRFSLWNAPDWLPERLRAEFPLLTFEHLKTYDRADEAYRDAEVAVAWTMRPEQLAVATQLRWVHSPAAAVHQLLFPEFVASPVILTNAREVHAPAVAEHVMAQLFALAKRIPDCVHWQQRRIWGQQRLWDELPRNRELAGATLGLVGMGAIGGQVAQRATALGMRVIAVREHPEKPADGVSAVYPATEIGQLLKQSDYVVLAAPLTPATRNWINAQTLAQMKPGTCLINVGRGALLDESALAGALNSGHLGGAALDVFSEEPLPATSPLWTCRNLLITPHSAGITERLWERHYVLIAENLRRYLKGDPLLGLVDKPRGY
jgi:phosphoglycerate dehydrogenase-like enzyme